MARGHRFRFAAGDEVAAAQVGPSPRPEVCDDCGQVIPWGSGGRCDPCQRERQEDIRKVRDFIAQNGPRPPWEIMAATGVSSALLVSLIREPGNGFAGAPADPKPEPRTPARPRRMYSRSRRHSRR